MTRLTSSTLASSRILAALLDVCKEDWPRIVGIAAEYCMFCCDMMLWYNRRDDRTRLGSSAA